MATWFIKIYYDGLNAAYTRIPSAAYDYKSSAISTDPAKRKEKGLGPPQNTRLFTRMKTRNIRAILR